MNKCKTDGCETTMSDGSPEYCPTCQLKADCLKALNCLYIAADASIAHDVNTKVKAYISALENRTAQVA